MLSWHVFVHFCIIYVYIYADPLKYNYCLLSIAGQELGRLLSHLFYFFYLDRLF